MAIIGDIQKIYSNYPVIKNENNQYEDIDENYNNEDILYICPPEDVDVESKNRNMELSQEDNLLFEQKLKEENLKKEEAFLNDLYEINEMKKKEEEASLNDFQEILNNNETNNKKEFSEAELEVLNREMQKILEDNEKEKAEVKNNSLIEDFINANLDEIKYQYGQSANFTKKLLTLDFKDAYETIKNTVEHNLNIQLNNLSIIKDAVFNA